MAFKEVVSLDASKTITIGGVDKKTKTPHPTEAEGYYLGNRTVSSNRFGDSILHFLQTNKGNLGVWGKTDLNRKLKSVQSGTMIRIEYGGTTPTPNGDMHKYKVLVDTDNQISVGDLNFDSANETSTNETNAEDTETEEQDYDHDDAYETPKPVVAAASAADRKAKVQALLNRKAK
jgi:hypothetical protein